MAKQLEQIRIGIWGTLYFVQWAYLGLGLSPARPDPKFNKKNLRQVALGIAQVRPTIIEQMKILKRQTKLRLVLCIRLYDVFRTYKKRYLRLISCCLGFSFK